MATWRDVRRIALALPETAEAARDSGPIWTVRGKMFAWERPLRAADIAALGTAAPAGAILGIRTPDLELKEALLASDPAVFLTTPHFDGYKAVLVILATISIGTLRSVIEEGWLASAPQRVKKTYLATKAGVRRREPAR